MSTKRDYKAKPVPKKATGFIGRRFTSFEARRPPVMPVYGELKFHDIDVDHTAANISAGVILNSGSINLIVQGISESQRIGRKCTIKKIGWRGLITRIADASSVLPVPMTTRIMLVLDKQANGATAAVTDVLETANYQSFNNLSNKGRFVVYSDQTHVMNSVNGAGNGTANDASAVQKEFTFFKKVDIPLEFSAAAGAITELRSNNLFVLMISSASQGVIGLDSKVRLRFEG